MSTLTTSTEWQPIETAPKDHPIDVWVRVFSIGAAGMVKMEQEWRVTNVWWGKLHYMRLRGYDYEHEHGKQDEWLMHRDYESVPAEDEFRKITHWMPIPKAPKS